MPNLLYAKITLNYEKPARLAAKPRSFVWKYLYLFRGQALAPANNQAFMCTYCAGLLRYNW